MSQCLAKVEPLLYALESGLAGSGVDVLSIQTESGPGQMELALAPLFDVASADAMFRLREAVKEMCSSRDLHATFMAKPTDTAGSNGLHFNHSLWSADTEHDKFHADGQLSEVGRLFSVNTRMNSKCMSLFWCPPVIAVLNKRKVKLLADYATACNSLCMLFACVAQKELDALLSNSLAT